MKTVTLGIQTYRGAHLLKSCLHSIKKSIFDDGYSNVEVLVVDDGSPKADANRIKGVTEEFEVRYVRESENRGFTARCNTIVEKSEGDIVCFVNNDVLIPNRWFISLLYFLTNNKCGVASYLSQKITQKEVPNLLAKQRVPAIGSGRAPERATELAGYCYGFLRENYDLVGGFDEGFKQFIQDSDFCCRLAEHGLMSYRILYPMVYHLEHATFDAYPELKYLETAKRDLATFKEKWGATPKEMEQKFLKDIEPQQITWYAHYAAKRDWDVEKPGTLFTKQPIRVTELKEVPPEYRGS